MSDLEINQKKKVVLKLLKSINNQKTRFKKRSAYYKRVDDISDGLLTFCSTATVTSIVLTYSNVSDTGLLVSGCLSSLSMIGGAVKQALSIKNKWSESRNSYKQLNDLAREVHILLARNHLTTTDIDNLLTDIHHRLALIDDSAPILANEAEESFLYGNPMSPKTNLHRLNNRFSEVVATHSQIVEELPDDDAEIQIKQIDPINNEWSKDKIINKT